MGEVNLPTSSLSQDVKSFLIDCIDSVSHLEVLLILHAGPTKSWDAEMMSKEMRSNVTSASTHLNALHKKGLLSTNDDKKFYYCPANEELAKKVNALCEAYHERPVAVISAIFERPNDKLKGFADAFKLKKD